MQKDTQQFPVAAKWFLAAAASMLAIVAICALYVGNEHPAYTWDYAYYWKLYQGYGALIGSDPGTALRRLFSEVNSQDYNPFAAVLLYPAYALFGGERLPYVIAISLLYLLPAAYIAALVSRRTIGDHQTPLIPIFVISLTFLPFWAPTLRGMVDVSGLIFLGLATLLVFKTEFLSSRPLRNGLLLGMLLWMPFLLRRWYAYSIIIFFGAAFVVGVGKSIIERRDRRTVISMIMALGVAAAVIAAFVLLFQRSLAIRVLYTSYGDLYDAYQVTFRVHLQKFESGYSWYMILLTLIGAFYLFSVRRFEGAFCFFSSIGTFLFFTRTQSLGSHHFLPIAFWLLPLFVAGCRWCSLWLGKSLGMWLFALISTVTFVIAITPIARSLGPVAHFIVPRSDISPLHLDGFDEYMRLVQELDKLTAPDQRFVIYASSPSASDSLFLALNGNLTNRVISSPHIAKRDFFDFEALRADYAVAFTPPQEHLAPGSQANISIPGQWLVEARGFGRAYEKIGTYKLQDGIDAFLYRRTRPVTTPEAKEVLSMLDEHYGWGTHFTESMAIPFTVRQETLGDVWGKVKVNSPRSLFVHPGDTSPTVVTLPFDPKVSLYPQRVVVSVDKAVLQNCADADGVSTTVALDGKPVFDGDVPPGTAAYVPIPKDRQAVTILVDGRSQPRCDFAIVTFQ